MAEHVVFQSTHPAATADQNEIKAFLAAMEAAARLHPGAVPALEMLAADCAHRSRWAGQSNLCMDMVDVFEVYVVAVVLSRR